jgi:hypothetical protein
VHFIKTFTFFGGLVEPQTPGKIDLQQAHGERYIVSFLMNRTTSLEMLHCKISLVRPHETLNPPPTASTTPPDVH